MLDSLENNLLNNKYKLQDIQTHDKDKLIFCLSSKDAVVLIPNLVLLGNIILPLKIEIMFTYQKLYIRSSKNFTNKLKIF